MLKKILTTEDWKDIWNLRKSGYKYKDIAEIYGVSAQCVQQGIERRKNQYVVLKHIFG